jgi:hypothetical protein
MRTNIRFATDILHRLGEELNPNADQGIIELVKNAYDADAINCTIELKNIELPGGSIRIWDDGDGMRMEDIVHGWLVLGRSQKATGKRTRLNRIPAGSKGLGRLAALRLGKTALLITRSRSNPNKQYTLQLNWADFEKANIVEDIILQIKEADVQDGKHGTEILIEGLTRAISRNEVKRLARSLILLADPFVDSKESFNPILLAEEFEDLERDEFITTSMTTADAVICDHRLTTYARFSGAEAVARFYQRKFPALLCTAWSYADIDAVRLYRRFIPVVINPGDADPETIVHSFKFCKKELSGDYSPARKPWRTLIRVVELDTEVKSLCIVIPFWNSSEVIRLPLEIIPAQLQPKLQQDFRFYAKVNLGCEDQNNLYFEDFELD